MKAVNILFALVLIIISSTSLASDGTEEPVVSGFPTGLALTLMSEPQGVGKAGLEGDIAHFEGFKLLTWIDSMTADPKDWPSEGTYVRRIKARLKKTEILSPDEELEFPVTCGEQRRHYRDLKRNIKEFDRLRDDVLQLLYRLRGCEPGRCEELFNGYALLKEKIQTKLQQIRTYAEWQSQTPAIRVRYHFQITRRGLLRFFFPDLATSEPVQLTKINFGDRAWYSLDRIPISGTAGFLTELALQRDGEMTLERQVTANLFCLKQNHFQLKGYVRAHYQNESPQDSFWAKILIDGR